MTIAHRSPAREADLNPPPARQGRTFTVDATLAFAVVFFANVVVRTAWIAGDAYLDFRTVENFVSGRGLRWNVADRVQAYTDPLWVMLLCVLRSLTHEWYYTVLLASITLAVTAAGLVASLAQEAAGALLALAVLSFSKAFVEYSTSGFETPLTFLLLACFWTICWKARRGSRETAIMALIGALVALTDARALLLLIPSIVVAARADRRGFMFPALAGCIQLLLWGTFALVYYGFPFPNPLYAFLSTQRSLGEIAKQGGVYLLVALDGDPLTIAAIVSVGVTGLSAALPDARPLGAGLLLYLAVLVLTGGDAVSGRALAAPVLCAAVFLARYPWSRHRLSIAVPVAAVVMLGLLAPGAPVLSHRGYGADREATLPPAWPGEPADPNTGDGTRDERRMWYPRTGLLHSEWYRWLPDTAREEDRVRALLSSGRHVQQEDSALFGFVAGPRLHLVDTLGRGDPLLARLPSPSGCRAVECRRSVPDGYLETLESGEAHLRDPAVAAYYEQLATVTRGRLFDPRRLRAIVDLNLHGFGAGSWMRAWWSDPARRRSAR